ncbi:hypothetical protein CS369_12295 [Candidatus Symbiopectobacterium sp. 'North America']|uniref:SDR family NAD(P)-dependent oxidoreductase n=1 Tax=Candidatus Symbiopectobacterium sp. 'North America' TaxID=2794574 RepID=UPI0018CAAA88|nr:SDR family oxidoreductase [Candidatus Symbiopectobacterium sp. 'North America']MBG6245350.1 hypothetical protein [Candidatus Symbiopectobacterium sp. 'North America']
MSDFFSGKVFLVTGASSGIGESVTLKLNALGAKVIAVGRNRERLEKVREKSQFPHYIFSEVKELAENIETMSSYVQALKDHYGKMQGLAWCAGISDIVLLRSLSYEGIKDTFAINYFSPLMMAKAFSDRRVNNNAGSSMVFVSSVAAQLCDRGHTEYAGSKAALCASIRCIAKELAPSRIRANCVLPSTIDTPLTTAMVEKYNTEHQQYSMGIGAVDDVSEMIIFLLSDKSAWITAQNYVVDCGSF